MSTPKSQNNNQEPLRIDNIVELSLPAKNSDAYEITNVKPHLFTLETTLRELQQKGDLEEVISVIQQVDESIAEYKKKTDSFYKIFFPVPMMILGEIDKKFRSNLSTEPLLKYLYISWKLPLSRFIYFASICVSVVSLSLLFLLGWTGQLIAFKFFIIIFVIGIFVMKIKIFDDTIENIVFTKIYQDICQVIDKLHKEHLNLVTKVLSIPTRRENMKIDNEFEKFQASLNTEQQAEFIKNKEKLEKLELEKRRNLHNLGAAMAIAEATNQKDVEIILAESELDKAAKELSIYEPEKIRNQAHEIALVNVRAEGKALVEEKKLLVEFLGKDHEKIRELEYQINQVKGFQGAIEMKGNQALTTPEAKSVLDMMMNKMQQPKDLN